MKLAVGLFHCVVIGSLLVGVFNLFYDADGDNECKMTYMWEYPEYAKIPFTPEIEASYPQYGLYFYGEGKYMKVMSQSFGNLEGIPVLFVPGNAGSYKQGRSIGSVLLRKSQKVQWSPHFNVFTVDLNEELMGIYGGTLKAQVKFVNHCIQKILSMYSGKTSPQPTSVVIVAHSMGGIIAKGLFMDPDFDHTSVNTILTYATPHQAPVANLDYEMNQFYEELNSYWQDNCDILNDISILSISGGYDDYHVNSALTKMPICTNDNNKISTISSHIPRVYATASHQCSVWCNQLVLATARALFDMIDPNTSQITNDVIARQNVLRHHFVHNPGYKAFKKKPEERNVKLTKHRTLINDFSWSLTSSDSGYVSFDIEFLLTKQKDLIVARTDSNKGYWIFLSKDTNTTSLPAVDVSEWVHETPKFVVAQLNLTQLQNQGYKLVIFNLKSRNIMDVAVLNTTDATIEYEMPQSLSNIWKIGKGDKVSIETTKGQFYHEVKLEGFYSIFHGYSVYVESSTVTSELLQFDVPWATGSIYSSSTNISIQLPFLNVNSDSAPSFIVFTNGNKGEISLKISANFALIMRQFFHYYGPMLLSMIAVNIFFAFTTQVNCFISNSEILSFGESHASCAKPYKIQPFTSLLNRLIMLPIFAQVWHNWQIPQPDFLILSNHLNIWFQFAPMCTFIFAYEILKILDLIMSFLIKKLFAKLFTKRTRPMFHYSFMMPIHIVVIALLMQLNISYIFLYTLFVHFLRTCCSAAVHNQSCSTKSNSYQQLEESTALHEDFEMNYSLLFMWFLLAICKLPALMSAVQGHRLAHPCTNYLAYGASIIFLVQLYKVNIFPKETKLHILSWLFFPAIVLCSIFAFVSLYRLPMFIIFFMTLHTVFILF